MDRFLLWFQLYPLYLIMYMFANKPNLESLLTFEILGLLNNQKKHLVILVIFFQIPYLSTSGKIEISL